MVNLVLTIIACCVAQLLAYSMCMAAFAAIDPLKAADFVAGFKPQPTLFKQMLNWPASLLRVFKFFPAAALIDAGGYTLMLVFLGPLVTIVVFVLNHIVVNFALGGATHDAR